MIRKTPVPISGGPSAIFLKSEVRTGIELEASGELRVLDPATWNELEKAASRIIDP